MTGQEPHPILREVLDRLVSSGLARKQEIFGCSAGEIRQLEASIGVPLPGLYRGFLEVMGRGAGDFLIGSDLFFPEVMGLRAAAEGLLADCCPGVSLPENALVFFMHQGYQFLYMLTGEGEDDPPVYYYLEGKEAPELKWPHFSAFLIGCLEDEVAIRAR
jgi:hypothetical protein